MTGANAIPAVLTADGLSREKKLIEFGQMAAFAEGRLPFVRSFRIEASCAPVELVPTEARVERCATTDTSLTVLASLDGAAVVVASYSRASDVSVVAVTPSAPKLSPRSFVTALLRLAMAVRG